MKSRDFCYWLQGFLELREGNGPISEHQVQLIAKHLDLVFKHEIDPSAGGEQHQATLNTTHGPRPDGTTLRC